MITVVRTELTADVSRALIGALNAELSGLYPEPGANHFDLDPGEVREGRGAFLVVHEDGTPVGCGALRRFDAETGELKRMYVSPSVRGTGLGRRLLAALEAEARALGVRRVVLETGVRQAAALALYRSAGFRPIPLYGEYRSSPDTSVCLAKDLDAIPTRFSGGCACGAIRYEASAAPLAMVNCHCRDCQRAGGSAYSPTVVVGAAAFRITSGEPRHHTVAADSGHTVRRAFCAECGAPLFATTSAHPGAVALRAGSLDDPGWFRPTADVWTAGAQPWDVMDPARPKFPKSRPRG